MNISKTTSAFIMLIEDAIYREVVIPKVFIKMKPARKQPITAPRLLIAKRLLTCHPRVFNCLIKNLKITGNVPPISVVGIKRKTNEKMNLTIWPA